MSATAKPKLSQLSTVSPFTDFPVTPSSAPDANYEVANKKYTDDTSTALINIMNPMPVGLLVNNNSGTPNTKIDITFTTLYVEGLLATAGTYTVNQAASGALGLDTGSVAPSTWYYLYVIRKSDGTTSAIMSLSSTTPTMPSGYIYKRLVSAAYALVSTSYFRAFKQKGNDVVINDLEIGRGTSGSYAALDATTMIPHLITKYIGGTFYATGGHTNQISSDSVLGSYIYYPGGYTPFSYFLILSNNIYYKSGSGDTTVISVNNYTLNI